MNFVKIKTVSRAVTYDNALRNYMLQVYNYMAIALAITGLVALSVASSATMVAMIFGSPLKWVVAFAPVIFVIMFSMKVQSMSFEAARMSLFIFAVLMGLSLTSMLLVYTGQSVARVFFITSAMFLSMSLYGYTTKKDMTGMGSFLMMGLIGIIIASLVNLFLQSNGLSFAISVIGVIVFTGLIAYDTQKIKELYYAISHGDEASISRAAVIGALSLYLDFINLFISMMHLFGDRK